MSKKQEETNLAVINQNGNETNLMNVSDNAEMIESRLDGLSSMKAGINISPEYYEFVNPGDKVRGLFICFNKFDKNDNDTGEIKELDAVVWMDEKRNLFSNAGTALVGAFAANKVPPYTPVEIEYLGQKKVERGYMKRYAVRPLVENEKAA